jgi:hypothetical protein
MVLVLELVDYPALGLVWMVLVLELMDFPTQ